MKAVIDEAKASGGRRRAEACLAVMLLSVAFGPVNWAAEPRAGWFVFAPTNTAEPGSIGLADWLDAPAGRHGVALMQGERIVFEDGTHVKFWGTNHGNLRVAPSADEADRRAAWYAKFGINAVRFHKFTWPRSGITSPEYSTRFEPELLARMDYYVAVLKRSGIYHTWSHIFGHKPAPGDRDRLLAFDEIKRLDGTDFRAGATYGIVNLFEDMQALNIELTVNLLNHVNPYTGLRYADEPALAMIELQNEDNVWWTAADTLESMPTYRARLAELFSEWLRRKYGTHEGLVAAWGDQGLDLWPKWQTGEHLDRNNIIVIPKRTPYQPEALATARSRQRLLDSARFLHERQDEFYQRFVAAIRATGYRGLITGSCWKADDGLPHYYNLLADARVGVIDRHNYFGGRGHQLEDGMATGHMGSMLARPDLGLLGVGLTQVHDRPFSFSEWTGKPPNPWIAEGPPVVAFYGMGLQDWDMSFHFGSRQAGFSPELESGNVYNTNSPTQIGTFPVLARAIHRGDVRPGEPLLPRRRVSLTNLERGMIGFEERIATRGDVNVVDGAVPSVALSVGRVELEFADEFVADPLVPPDLARWRDGSVVRANTGELVRDTAGGGWFSVNTSATKGIVGFASGQTYDLGGVRFSLDSDYGVALLTSRDRDRDLAGCRSALVVLLARVENTGQRFNADGSVLTAVGGPPLLMEGVRLTLRWPRLEGATVHVLDHDGRRRSHTVAVEGDTVRLDAARDRTIYYEISWP